MAKIRQGNTISVTHDGTQIEGARDYNYKPQIVEKKGASDGESEDRVTTDFKITGEMTFDSEAAHTQALDGARSNLVITSTNIAGGTRVTTIKNVEFTEYSGTVPTRQSQDFATWKCSFVGIPGPSDLTPSAMVSHAAGV